MRYQTLKRHSYNQSSKCLVLETGFFYTIASMRKFRDGINMFVATVRSPNSFGFLHFEAG